MSNQEQKQDQPVLKNPLDEKKEGEENVLKDAQDVVHKLDEQNPKSVEEQEHESAQEAEKLKAETKNDDGNKQ